MRLMRPIYGIGITGALLALGTLLVFSAMEVPRRRVEAICLGNLRQIATAAQAYRDTYGQMPQSLSALMLVGRLTELDCSCPFQSHRRRRTIDYLLVSGLSGEDPGDWLLAFDKAQNHANGTRGIVTLDGQAQLMTESTFRTRLEAFSAEFARLHGLEPELRDD